MSPPLIYVGCAGWSLPPAYRKRFPASGSHLECYAQRFPAVEINSSFYRPHRPATYAKWAASVPASFRFSVKLPKTITHENRLAGVKSLLETFLGEVTTLGDKLGALLVQLPPSLTFDARVAGAFFKLLRKKYKGIVMLEPRHPTWFTARVELLLKGFRVGRVAADPATVAAGAEPGGWPDVAYFRLHGSPRMYYSSYTAAYLRRLAGRLRKTAASGHSVWCIFDNTAYGVATGNAFDLLDNLQSPAPVRKKPASRRAPKK